jgi:hypothetical protein
MEPDHELVPDDQPQPGDSGPRQPRTSWWRPLAAACVIAGLLAAAGAVGYALITVTRHLSGASSPSGNPAQGGTASASPSASPPVLPGTPSGPLQVIKVYTYQQGAMVFVDIYYADRDNNAGGFGFMGVDGSRIAEVNYPFSSPGDGIVETGSITYPFNEGCGTAQHHSDSIEVWVTDTAGKRSPPSTPVHLACAP